MPQKPVELILLRHLASCLAIPIFLMDAAGSLVFYNEPAEALLGRRYDETGELPLAEWSPMLAATAEDGSRLSPEAHPPIVALQKRQAAHRAFRLRGFDGVSRGIEMTAFPLEGQGGRHLGAVAICWNEDRR